MKKISIVLIVSLLSTFFVKSQTKQEIYCNSNIIWAGIVDIDIVPNLQKDQNWDVFGESGLSKLNFNQKSTYLKKGEKILSDQVIGHANDGTLDFYNDATLKTKIDYQLLELTAPNIEPETIGERGKEYPASSFEVYRLRCLVYYQKDQLDFKVIPQTVAVIRTEYDGPNSNAFYNILGWLPVQEWVETMQVADKNITWAQCIHSDVQLRNIKVFKQELTIQEVFEKDLVQNLLEDPSKYELLVTQNFKESKPMTAEEKKEVCTDEIVEFDPNSYEEIISRIPKTAYGFVGINFSINWAWNNTTKQFYTQQIQSSPILHNMDIYSNETSKEMFLNYMYTKKIK